jgi:glycine/D-amino acid oxidase-like deaminating enzyme
MRSVQAIIVGQGFAGTALAWTLESRGIDFVVIDNETPQTSSRIASGLVTPITGKRLVKTWEWDEAWKRAQTFYREIEIRTETSFWSVQPSLRLLDSDEERSNAQTRATLYPELISPFLTQPTLNASIDQSYGGFVMNEAARLDGPAYLEASRNAFHRQDAYVCASLDLKNDILVRSNTIEVPKLEIRASTFILCQGHSSIDNPWFPSLPLVPAQGDILTLRISDFFEMRTIHRNLWITPANHDGNDPVSPQYLVGSTYRWHVLDGLPSPDARQEILTKLSKWLDRPVEVINHRSAIRPTSFDQKPLIGRSLIAPEFWVFNGLGAKGTLMAPWCAQQLVAAMVDGVEVRSSLTWDRRGR